MGAGTSPLTAEGDLEPGRKVGEYVVDAKLGQGGFGSVFRARHPLIGKLAAVKVLSRKFSADPEIVSRFRAEARAVNQIRHRNIIDIFGFGELEDGRSYYIMELLEGEPLDARIGRQGAMPLQDALPILRALARALDAAHAQGIATAAPVAWATTAPPLPAPQGCRARPARPEIPASSSSTT